MCQAVLSPNLTKKFQWEVSQIADNRFPCVMLLGGLSVNLNHLKRSSCGKWIFLSSSWFFWLFSCCFLIRRLWILVTTAPVDMSGGTGCICGVPVLSVTYQICYCDHRLYQLHSDNANEYVDDGVCTFIDHTSGCVSIHECVVHCSILKWVNEYLK